MLEVVRCLECDDVLKELEVVYRLWNGKYICEVCRGAYYVYCDDCHNLTHVKSIMAADGNRHICEICADQYHTCDHCEGLCSGYNLAVNTYSLTLCGHCYNEYYFTCDRCGEVYHNDDSEYINGEYYCNYCADDYRDCIQSYSYKPAPVFYGGENAGYGVELEIDDGDCRQDAAGDIQAAGGEHIYLKEDGSLSDDGMEIVTHPATLDYHINQFPWADICHVALSYGYRSHDTDTCGLHIHVSRELFGDNEVEQDLTIAKIMLLIDRWYDTKIVRFARRDLHKMRRWADKPNANIQPSDDDIEAVRKSKKHAGDRYRAVNLCNYRTVEFRFFKGTLKRDTIIASIQWVDTIINYCKHTPLKDLFDATWDEIFGSTGHAELTAYLKRRNLLKKEVI